MTGFIYAIESGGFVKIGWSRDPQRRLDKIRSDAPHESTLLGVRAGTSSDEKAIQQLLGASRSRGEWFHMEGTQEFLQSLSPFKKPSAKTRKPFNRLDAYLLTNGLKDAYFAGLIGRDRTTVSRWRRGLSRPEWKDVQLIVRVTKGEVTPNDFLTEAAQ